MSYELEFDKNSLVVNVEEDGLINWAVVHVHTLIADLDCTEYIKNSSYWTEKIAERLDEIKNEKDGLAEWKLSEDR